MRVSNDHEMRLLRFIAANAYLAGFRQGRETPENADTREALDGGFERFWRTIIQEDSET